MVYDLIKTKQYCKDYDRANKQNKNIALLDTIIEKLQKGEEIDKKYKLHTLTGNHKGVMELHVNPDWLLEFMKVDDEKENIHTIVLLGLGSHTYLFGL